MKKIDLGQTISTLANVGVIAGIIFLGVELQQNNDLLSAQARAVRHEFRAADANRSIFSDSELAEIMRKSGNDEPLTDTEAYMRDRFERQQTLNWQFVYVEYLYGAIEFGEIPVVGWCQAVKATAGSLDRWERSREAGYLQPDFIEFMDDEVLTQC